MKEEELLTANHVGEVINILQKTTHDLFDPDELLTVTLISCFTLSISFSRINTSVSCDII